MARIFQKYVTDEGRSETPPSIVDSALRQVSAGRKEGDPQPKLGGSSIKMSDLSMEGEHEEEGEEGGMDNAISMYILMKGLRNMMQYMMKMSKGMNFG